MSFHEHPPIPPENLQEAIKKDLDRTWDELDPIDKLFVNDFLKDVFPEDFDEEGTENV